MFSPVAESPRWLTLMIMFAVLILRTDTAFSLSKDVLLDRKSAVVASKIDMELSLNRGLTMALALVLTRN